MTVTQYDGDFQDVFSILVQHLSSIFEACQNTRANNFKVNCGQSVSEADWRHDFDCLLIKFFKCTEVGDVTVNSASTWSSGDITANAPGSCPNAQQERTRQNSLVLPSYVSFFLVIFTF